VGVSLAPHRGRSGTGYWSVVLRSLGSSEIKCPKQPLAASLRLQATEARSSTGEPVMLRPPVAPEEDSDEPSLSRATRAGGALQRKPRSSLGGGPRWANPSRPSPLPFSTAPIPVRAQPRRVLVHFRSGPDPVPGLAPRFHLARSPPKRFDASSVPDGPLSRSFWRNEQPLAAWDNAHDKRGRRGASRQSDEEIKGTRNFR
jgi:hypothetical protein